MTDEEEFFAWLDGELDGEAAAKVAARVAADPVLGEQARAHRALGEQLRGAFDPLMTAPAPDRSFFDQHSTPPIDLAAARERRTARRLGVPQWAAIAATLVFGIGLGSLVGDRGGQGPVAITDGRMLAAANLETALDTQLASAETTRQATRIGLSFRDKSGALCRSFEGEGAAGLACRDDNEWRIEGLYGASGGSQGDYRMAAGGDSRLAALIDSTIAGEPLDADGERAAQANGWR